jgi:hypothetical protein
MNSDHHAIAPGIDALIKKIPQTQVSRIFSFAFHESPDRHASWRGRPLIDYALSNPNPSAVMTIIYKAYHIAVALRALKKPELFKEAKTILDRITYRVYQIWGKFRCDVIYGFSKLKFFDAMDAHAGWKDSVSETGVLWDLQRDLEEKGRVFAGRMASAWDAKIAMLQIPAIGLWAAKHLANSRVVFAGHDMGKILESAWTVSSVDMVSLLVSAINSRCDDVVGEIWDCFYWRENRPESTAELAPIVEALKRISTEIDAFRILKHFTTMSGTCKAVWNATKRSTTKFTPHRKPDVKDGPNGMLTSAELDKLRSNPETEVSEEMAQLSRFHDLVFVYGDLLRIQFEKVTDGQWNGKPDEMLRATIGLVGGVQDTEEYRKLYLPVFHARAQHSSKDPELKPDPELENATSCTGMTVKKGEFRAQYWYNCLTCSIDFDLDVASRAC